MRFILFILLLALTSPALAQKKELLEAKTNIKNNSNLDKAESVCRKLLTDSLNRSNVKIYEVLAEAVRKQYENANEKLYLKEKYDTTSLFLTAKRMFEAYALLDSVDAQPNDKGVVKPRLRKRNAAFLCPFAKNLFTGGVFFLRKRDFKNAYSMMSSYIETARRPLLSTCPKSKEQDSLLLSAAYWTLYAGYNMRKPDMALSYEREARQEKWHYEKCLRYISECSVMLNDTAKYVSTLLEGQKLYPASPYFVTHLLDYYNATQDMEKANSVVDEALKSDNESNLFQYAKSNLLLLAGKYDDCITLSKRIIERCDTFSEAYYNVGSAFLNKAFRLESDFKTLRQNKQKIQECYQQALPYMERYRALCPNEEDKWAAALYNIYLKLNMGKQFEEIDRLIRK